MRSRNDTDVRGETSTRSHGPALSRLKEPKQQRLGLSDLTEVLYQAE